MIHSVSKDQYKIAENGSYFRENRFILNIFNDYHITRLLKLYRNSLD